MQTSAEPPPRVTYLVIDGENLDATLGGSVLGRRPAPEERPRWERVVDFAQRLWAPGQGAVLHQRQLGQPAHALPPGPAGHGPAPGAAVGAPGDEGRRRGHPAHARAHRGRRRRRHAGQPRRRLPAPGRRPARRRAPGGLLAFREFVNAGYLDLTDAGLEIFDLEDDAGLQPGPAPHAHHRHRRVRPRRPSSSRAAPRGPSPRPRRAPARSPGCPRSRRRPGRAGRDGSSSRTGRCGDLPGNGHGRHHGRGDQQAGGDSIDVRKPAAKAPGSA